MWRSAFCSLPRADRCRPIAGVQVAEGVGGGAAGSWRKAWPVEALDAGVFGGLQCRSTTLFAEAAQNREQIHREEGGGATNPAEIL